MSFIGGECHQDNTFLNTEFTMKEMISSLNDYKESASGPDSITVSMIGDLWEESENFFVRGTQSAPHLT